MKHTCPVKRTEHNIGQQQKKHRSTLPNFPDITRTFKERLVGGHTIMSSDESAIALKEKGNAAFAAKNYEEAEGLYSQAIAMLGEDAPHTLYGNRAAARLGLGRAADALADAETAIQKDGRWLKGYHRKACAHQAMGESGIALETYRQALDLEPKNKWLKEQVRQAKADFVNTSKTAPIASVEAWIAVFESMSDSRERLSTLAHLWNQCELQDRHHIFGQFLTLIAGAGRTHTGVHPEDFTEDMMVSLPMDNYEDLKPVDSWMAFFRGLSREEKVRGFKLMWDVTEDGEKNVIVNDLRHFFLEPLLNAGAPQEGGDDDEEDEEGEREGGLVQGAAAATTAAAGGDECDATASGAVPGE
eukprot:jgi/Undpi1/11083/HiC_scaffold_30.g13381.m1